MREFLEFVIRQLIEFPDDMVLTEIPSGRTTIFKLQLRSGDVGRVIGRGGQTIHAIRALLASSAARHGQRAVLEIVEYLGFTEPYSSTLDVERCAFDVSFLNENRYHHAIPGNLPCAIE